MLKYFITDITNKLSEYNIGFDIVAFEKEV